METRSSSIDVNSLHFTKEGWIDYSKEKLAPTSSYEPFWWEWYDWRTMVEWANRNVYFPFVISGIYIVVIFGLQAFMRNRKAFGLQKELALWNGALSLFSILGVFRVAPDLWGKINRPNGLYYSLCKKDDISVPMAFWASAFVVSKFVELGDTLFIVLRKRPLQFLQWFHHALTLILAFHTGPYIEPLARWCIFCNYFVHSLMYPYFSLRALDVSIPKKIANFITMTQLLQMILVVGINLYTTYQYYFVGDCHRHPNSMKMVSFSYGIFMVLFAELFYRLVFKKKDAKKGKVE